MIVLPVTYKLISTVTVSSATAASIEFTSIPATFDDLVLKLSARGSDSSFIVGLNVFFNSDTTGGNYSNRRLYGSGSAAASDTGYSILISAATATANTFGNAEIYIPNYRASVNKSVSIDAVTENNATGAYQVMTARLWSNTAAITSISLQDFFAGSFSQYSSATLYGIKKS